MEVATPDREVLLKARAAKLHQAGREAKGFFKLMANASLLKQGVDRLQVHPVPTFINMSPTAACPSFLPPPVGDVCNSGNYWQRLGVSCERPPVVSEQTLGCPCPVLTNSDPGRRVHRFFWVV
ncbi:hypothetical protein C0Q70_04588 [Pomacea canaliculata]|uniref:Uncharacterized protein n=1 Tax=Pomacea canaliculata TaxID=400727 RepID=A0A2T7PIU3_POMCA|nr:hypothetical protein C0Q70_04588 [Pomacea canaliculata]